MCARQCRPSPTQVAGGHNRATSQTTYRYSSICIRARNENRIAGIAGHSSARSTQPRPPRVTRQRAPARPATASLLLLQPLSLLLLLRRRRRAAVMIARRGLSIAGVSAGKACDGWSKAGGWA